MPYFKKKKSRDGRKESYKGGKTFGERYHERKMANTPTSYERMHKQEQRQKTIRGAAYAESLSNAASSATQQDIQVLYQGGVNPDEVEDQSEQYQNNPGSNQKNDQAKKPWSLNG